jgi:hypothetical protein
MPYPGYHSARIQDPDKYPKKRYGKDAFGNGVDVVWGITDAGKTVVQAIRFDKTLFTPEEARAWLKKHPEHKVISFEPATAAAKTQKMQSDPYDRFQRTLWDLSQDAPGYAQVHYCPTCRLNKVEGHDAILQGLDRKVGNLFFGKGPFVPTVDDWNSIPIIFSKIHADPLKFDQDPEAELTRIDGAITGELSDAALETVGRARLMVRKNYTDDTAFRLYDEGKISVGTLNRSLDALPKSLQLIEEGKLSHSSAFICPDDGEALYGVVRPSHVLDFEETPVDQPVDRMSVILNKQETENVTEENEHLNIGKVISSKNEGKLRAAMDAFKKFFEDILAGGEEPAPPAEPKMNAASGSVPSNPSGGGISSKTMWVKKTEADFGSMPFSDIRKRFAWDDGSGNFTGLKLGHHEVNGDVNHNGVTNALARLSQSQGVDQAAVKAHLDAHMTKLKAAAKTQAMTLEAPAKESLEGQIDRIRKGLSDKVGMLYPDGSKRMVWPVMTLPDKVIWQNPDTMKYYSTPYTLSGENVTFGDPVEVEQAYVVKTAKMIFTGMTPEDIETITRRNKMADTPPAEDPKVKELTDQMAKLQKELDDTKAALKTHEDAKVKAQKDKFDADWQNLEKTVIPPGEVKDPADKAKLQKMSVDDPLGFAAKVASWKKAPALGAEGTTHAQGPGGEDKEAERNRILSVKQAIPGTLH